MASTTKTLSITYTASSPNGDRGASSSKITAISIGGYTFNLKNKTFSLKRLKKAIASAIDL